MAGTMASAMMANVANGSNPLDDGLPYSDQRRHGWQLKPIGHGPAIRGGRLRRRGGHLVYGLNEARQPDGIRLHCWQKSAHWIFRSTTVN
jgi:hypothetical protein